MCTFTLKNPELQIAKHDIVTYKIVSSIRYIPRLLPFLKEKAFATSFIMGAGYEFNKTYTTKLDPFTEIYSHIIFSYGYTSGRGYYSYENKQNPGTGIAVKCIIPKGAKYYYARDYNISDSIVYVYHSDKIKIVEIA